MLHPESPPPPPVETERHGLRVVGVLLGWKICFGAVVVCAVWLLPNTFNVQEYYANFSWPPGEPPAPVSMLKTWDAQHYLYLSEHGYHAGERSIAFFPLWPLAIHIGAPLFGGNSLLAGLVLANVLSVIGLLLFHRFATVEYNVEVADTALLLMIAYPGTLFFSFAYSEALFFTLTLLAMRALSTRRWQVVAATGVLLPLTRAIGVFMIAPFSYALYLDWKQRKRVSVAHVVTVLTPLLGFGAYLLFMRSATGDAFSGFAIQRRFTSYRPPSQWLNLFDFLRSFLNVRSFHGYTSSVFDRLCFLLLLATLVRLWTTKPALLLYALPVGVWPAMTVSFMSYSRYLAVIFPAFLVAADWLAPAARRDLRWMVLALLLSLQALALVLHVNNYWVG